jgi:hypothetical protein
MAKPKPQPPKPQPAKVLHEMWSAISPGDLGLKAGYWTGKEGDALTFRDIVGWATVVSREVPSDEPPKNDFFAVVLADNMFPVVATIVPHYCGVFLKAMAESEAKKAAVVWMKQPRPNVSGFGQA